MGSPPPTDRNNTQPVGANQMRHQWSQLTRTCVDRLIITRCPSHQWDAQYRCMKRQSSGAHGHTTPLTDGIYQLTPNIITCTDVTLKQPKVNGSWTQSTSVTNISQTITHADKVMNAIAECAKAIKDITSPNGAEEMQQLVELTEQAIHQHPAIIKSFAEDSTTPSVLRVHMTIPMNTHSVPRVQRTETAQQLTR